MQVEIYCGGPVETNGYLLTQGGMVLVVDAPEGMTNWIANCCRKNDLSVAGLLLTHGHWDHIMDVHTFRKQFRAPVWIHRDSLPLLEDPSIQSAFNPFQSIKSCKADHILGSEGRAKLSIFEFGLLLCPGHCPGSVCFYFAEEKMLFGGDVLFAGGVGRWDLPAGSREELMRAIKTKILILPAETRIFPGHGPPTTVGEERRSNPYLSAFQEPSK